MSEPITISAHLEFYPHDATERMLNSIAQASLPCFDAVQFSVRMAFNLVHPFDLYIENAEVSVDPERGRVRWEFEAACDVPFSENMAIDMDRIIDAELVNMGANLRARWPGTVQIFTKGIPA